MNHSTTIPRIPPSLTSVEGLRIPPTLDSTTSVSFVLTQEPGKLKPKDLKIAIEKNRAEKELRALEQKKIREEGGGAGVLDLRGILAEERLNVGDGDPFKKQLREMAFLADVDDVDKQEIEKGFRISEDYLGANILTDPDIDVVYKQRLVTDLHNRRSDWRVFQDRQTSQLYSYVHPYNKAGASTDIALKTMDTFSPLFDANRNDIWGKRMNTLRRFISLVSRWIIRKRVTQRMGKITQLFLNNGAITKEQVKEFIEQENNLSRKKSGQTKPGAAPTNTMGNVSFEETKNDANKPPAPPPVSVASMVFSTANDDLVRKELNEAAAPQLDEINVNSEMCRRVLFPQCFAESSGGSSRVEIPQADIKSLIQFDDRTFFQLKVQAEYQTLEYDSHSMPACSSLYFPPSYEECPFSKPLRSGALEEYALIQPVDALFSLEDFTACEARPVDIATAAPPPKLSQIAAAPTLQDPVYQPSVPNNLPERLAQLRSIPSDTPRRHLEKVYGIKTTPTEEEFALEDEIEEEPVMEPVWLGQEDLWNSEDLDFTEPLSIRKYALFGTVPQRIETDSDWGLRPGYREDELEYKHDDSLRTKLVNSGTFSTVNKYLLGGHLSRSRKPILSSGPTLTDKYFPDEDRHLAGLHCWEKVEHMRSVWEKDADVAPLQDAQDKADYLTDSESDDDDEYPENELSMKNVKRILKPSQVADDAEAVEEEYNERKDTQVEMLIDRKRMELASTLYKTRIEQQDRIFNRISEVSSKSVCPLLALPVQMPFHTYEEELYQQTEKLMAPVQTTYVEPAVTKRDKKKAMEKEIKNISVQGMPANRELVNYTGNNYPYVQFSVPLVSPDEAAA